MARSANIHMRTSGESTRRARSVGAGLLAAAVWTVSCSSPKPTPSPTNAPELWGDLTPVVSVKELMRDMLDPAADNIFESVKVVITKDRTIETIPKTDEDWD